MSVVHPPDRLPCGSRLLDLTRPQVMGILNVTPDSFSDGGRFFDPQTAIARGLELVAAGADLLDIGGESTRPYSAPVSAEEELRRVLPVVQNLAQQCKAALSIDTSKSVVAQACLEAGAEIINDVTGLTGDPQMLPLAVKTGAAVCVMHMQGTPQTMQDDPHYANVTQDILQYLLQRRASLESVGIPRPRIALDPGIGFGKTHAHNLTLLSTCWQFHTLDCPLLLGPSRKGFIAKVLGDKEIERDTGTIGVALALASQGVQVLRVHDVASIHRALQLFIACGAMDG